MLIANAPAPEGRPFPNEKEVQSWGLYTLSAAKLDKACSAAVLKGWQYTGASDRAGRIRTQYLKRQLGVADQTSAATRRAQDAYRELAAQAEARGSETKGFEIRALRIPALNLEAMWLHSHAGGDDYVVPYRSLLAGVKVGEKYRLQDVMAKAKQAAERLRQAPEV